ncbi:MAG: galactokinase [Candidatus Thorarchaeota archaeon]
MDVPQGMLQKLREMAGHNEIKPTLSKAPGRIEVLGNHTDYNSGMVLAASIDKFVWILGIPDHEVHIYAADYDEEIRFNLNSNEPSNQSSWEMYVRGVFWAFKRRKHNIKGLIAVIHGDVPKGGGLSSSAALEVSLANLIQSVSELSLQPKPIAMIAFEAERLYCGISCGIMDQFTSQLGEPNALVSINCRNLQTQSIPMDNDAQFVAIDSKVTRSASDPLNKRRHECVNAVETLRDSGWSIQNLSDITPQYLVQAQEVLDETAFNRVSHVVNENARVLEGMSALVNHNLVRFGELMFESHTSSRDLYEVSHPRLDLLVELSNQVEGVLGSRLTGAGFGGSVLALVRRGHVDDFCRRISANYESGTGVAPEVTPISIPGGVKIRRA